jgi:hypothetical protein
MGSNNQSVKIKLRKIYFYLIEMTHIEGNLVIGHDASLTEHKTNFKIMLNGEELGSGGGDKKYLHNIKISGTQNGPPKVYECRLSFVNTTPTSYEGAGYPDNYEIYGSIKDVLISLGAVHTGPSYGSPTGKFLGSTGFVCISGVMYLLLSVLEKGGNIAFVYYDGTAYQYFAIARGGNDTFEDIVMEL